jgi:hypothetical protein
MPPLLCLPYCRSKLGCCRPNADLILSGKAGLASDTKGAAKQRSKKSGRAAELESYRKGKVFYPRSAQTACVWDIHFLSEPVPISQHVSQTGYATATW